MKEGFQMSSTQGLFGGGAAGDEKKAKAEDFINRYSTGDPSEGYTEEEAETYFKEATAGASPEQVQQAVKQSLEAMPEDQRAQFEEMLKQRQAGKGMVDIQRSGERTPAGEASAQGAAAGGDSAGLDDLLGGLLGGLTGGSTGATASGGGDSGGIDDMITGFLGSPAGKTVMAGAAAVLMKQFMGKN
jgi:hypothetical protein